MTREQFVKTYYPAAAKAAQGTGIFPQVMISQAIIESSGRVDGVWMPGQSLLARQANNYFGIKADPAWKGDTISLKTGEYLNGQYVTITGKFRKYATIGDSFADYISFLKKNPRYTTAGVFSASTPESQAVALQKAGYATDPNYSKLIVGVMNSIKGWIPKIGGVALGLIVPAILFFLIFKKSKA